MPVVFEKPEPYVVRLDGESVRLHFKQMSVGEFEEFDAVFTAFGSGRLEPGPAKAKEPAATLTLVRERAARDAELSEENAAWIRSVFERYVTVEPGDVVIDGQSITAGERFLRAIVGISGYEGIITGVLMGLWLEHRLTPAQKKNLTITARFRDWLGGRASKESVWRQTGDSCHACRARDLCGTRGCDGTVQTRIVWHDGPAAVLRVCPVRFLSPRLDRALGIFRHCYAPTVVGFGGVMWQRVCLPGPGGLLEQDEWLMAALSHLCDVHNQMTREAQKRHRRKTKQDQKTRER